MQKYQQEIYQLGTINTELLISLKMIDQAEQSLDILNEKSREMTVIQLQQELSAVSTMLGRARHGIQFSNTRHEKELERLYRIACSSKK